MDGICAVLGEDDGVFGMRLPNDGRLRRRRAKSHRRPRLKRRPALKPQNFGLGRAVAPRPPSGICVIRRKVVVPQWLVPSLARPLPFPVRQVVDEVLACARCRLKEHLAAFCRHVACDHMRRVHARRGMFHEHALDLRLRIDTPPFQHGAYHAARLRHAHHGAVVAESIRLPSLFRHDERHSVRRELHTCRQNHCGRESGKSDALFFVEHRPTPMRISRKRHQRRHHHLNDADSCHRGFLH